MEVGGGVVSDDLGSPKSSSSSYSGVGRRVGAVTGSRVEVEEEKVEMVASS